MDTYKGGCFCSAVEFTVSGEPAAAGYCHCESCRLWSAGPVNAFSLWKPEAVKITRGAAKIGGASGASVNFRIGNRRRTFQEVEVAALVGLLHVAREDCPI